MAKCDHVVAQELLFGVSKDNEKMIDNKLKGIEKILSKNNITADVFHFFVVFPYFISTVSPMRA